MRAARTSADTSLRLPTEELALRVLRFSSRARLLSDSSSRATASSRASPTSTVAARVTARCISILLVQSRLLLFVFLLHGEKLVFHILEDDPAAKNYFLIRVIRNACGHDDSWDHHVRDFDRSWSCRDGKRNRSARQEERIFPEAKIVQMKCVFLADDFDREALETARHFRLPLHDDRRVWPDRERARDLL